MSFKNITPEEYNRLIKNRIFDLTFKTPERVNTYRDNKDIYNDLKIEENRNKKIKDYNNVLNDNLNKYFIQTKDKKKIINTLEFLDNLLKQSKDSNDIDKIKNTFKLLSKKDEIKFDSIKIRQ